MSADVRGHVISEPVGVVDGIFGEHGVRLAVASADTIVTVRGWALDAGSAAFVAIECAIGHAAALQTCVETRIDVAEAHDSPPDVGFVAVVALQSAGLGPQKVRLAGIRADDTRVGIPVNAAVDVVPALSTLPDLPRGSAIGAVDELGAEAEALRHTSNAGLPAVPERGVIKLTGWAATPTKEPLAAAYAQIDGGRVVRGMAGYPRPDVASSLATDRVDYGFRIRIPAAFLEPGVHSIRVLVEAGGVLSEIGDAAGIFVAANTDMVPSRSADHGGVDLVGRVDADNRVLDHRSGLRLRRDERMVVTGWAGNPQRAALPDIVVLTVDDVVHGVIQRGLLRQDVVAATGCDAMACSGFSTVIRADRLAAGHHRAELLAVYGSDPVLFDAFSFEVTG